jgi:hypothetical protein
MIRNTLCRVARQQQPSNQVRALSTTLRLMAEGDTGAPRNYGGQGYGSFSLIYSFLPVIRRLGLEVNDFAES